MNASDQIPGRIPRFEERLHRQAGLVQLAVERCVDAPPKIAQHGRRQVFRSDHGRNGRDHSAQISITRRRHGRLVSPLGDTGQRTQRRDVMGRELAPVRQHRRQADADRVGTEMQQAVTGAARKRVLYPRMDPPVRCRRTIRRLEAQNAVRGQSRREYHDGGISPVRIGIVKL
jgi:hypothetical protein